MFGKIKIFLALLVSLLYPTLLSAGISGTLSGTVLDQETGNTLPGASILVEGTTMGAMADRNGYFIIYNLPAGTYNISASMIGYTKLTIKNVKINIDLNTSLKIFLSAEVLPLNEVIITGEKKLIESEITSSTYFISGVEINDKLPIDSYLDAVTLLPGVVGTHIRGGRNTEILYLLDGLPLQGAFSRTLSSYIPNNSVVEMMVQTGGFSAEYGHASSGIVNVITKDGRNKVEGSLKIQTDFLHNSLFGNDKTKRLEFNIGGPMIIGLGGPLINAKYFISAALNLSDSQFRTYFDGFLDSPIYSNYNINTKFSLDIARNTIFTFQALVSNQEWYQFDPQWALNPQGLAKRKHYSHRLSGAITHTFSSQLFASVRAANYITKRLVLGDVDDGSPNLTFADPTNPQSLILSGNLPWDENTIEKNTHIKIDLVGKMSSGHLFKTGMDIQNYNVASENEKYEPVLKKGSVNKIAYNKIEDNYQYQPHYVSLYFQDNIEFNGINANLGLRYDVFAPKISLDKESNETRDFKSLLNAPLSTNSSKKEKPISPRLGVSLPLSQNERLHLNYGWYYQMPSLYYMYLNTEHQLDSYLPFWGNVELEPVKTISSEFSYKRVVADDFLFVFTGFIKKTTNMIDTQTFILPDSLFSESLTNIGFTQYINSAHSSTSGFEVTLQKRLTNFLTTRISYTYMKARGTNSSEEEEFDNTISAKFQNLEKVEFPLSWDQRHTLIIDAGYNSKKIDINLLYRLFSPLPFTSDESITPNDKRLSWRNLLDIRIKLKSQRLLKGNFYPFFEIRNVFNDNNEINQLDNTGVEAYRLFYPIRTDHGRRLRLGMALEF